MLNSERVDGVTSRVRAAHPEDLAQLAQVWFDGWHDAHAGLVPAAVLQHRTIESFAKRLSSRVHDIRVIGNPGELLGFTMIDENELDQIYVAASARGSGVARSLIKDALRRIASEGHQTAWLVCAVGNDRAARFYEKAGWQQTGEQSYAIETPSGRFALTVWRYEFSIKPGAG